MANFKTFELSVIQDWSNINLKSKIKESRMLATQWSFLDGPPFINGKLHHGHMLVTFIKDTFARFMSQQGYQIPYQLGFDCHGLPLEQEAEKKVNKEKIVEFNNECRNIISNCSQEWFSILERLGRQFDIDKTYYTSSFSYMQSIWWAFGKLWNDELIYCSKKVMPYSPLCETPISNFEASSNYKIKTDISVYIKFKITDSDEYLLIWTTTPWSLFANQGICVNSEFNYSLILYEDLKLWICDNCIPTLGEFTIIKSVKGTDLVGLVYDPIFTLSNYNNYKVYADNYVDNKTGTGLVHLAPLFGEDDMRVMKLNGYMDIMLPEYLVDKQIKFTFNYLVNNVDIKDTFVMDCSENIVIHLKKEGHAIKSQKIEHNYPYCWRTDFPLIYLATNAWFMNIQKIIPDLIENNKKIIWYPDSVGTERFANWIKKSPDWCLSRNRVWGTPIPVWVNEIDSSDMICIDSIEKLSKYTGEIYNDLHLDKIGDIKIQINNKIYKRTFGILDCWFESGMAQLSQYGYPECINALENPPIDFIVEGIDQTRGWFYTLNVLSTALMKQPAFKKVVVSGLILAEDGKKMSKRLGNYTSPDKIIEKYGVDVIRLYLIGSPAAKAEEFCFKDSELMDITKSLLPYYNAHLLFNEYYINAKNTVDFIIDDELKLENNLDIWIKNKYIELAQFIYKKMNSLELYCIVNHILIFIDNLCNIYIRFSKENFKLLNGENEGIQSLQTLYYILINTNLLLAPFMPHLTDYFSKLINTNHISNHLEIFNYEQINNLIIDKNIINSFYSINELLEAVRGLRNDIHKNLKYPLQYISVYTDNINLNTYSKLLCHELNIKEIHIYPTSLLKKIYVPNKALLGKKYKKDANKYSALIESGDINFDECIPEYYNFDYIIEEKENMIFKKFNYYDEHNSRKIAVVYLLTVISKELTIEADINFIKRKINNIRNELGLKIYNKIEIIFDNNPYWDLNKIALLETKLSVPIKIVNNLNKYHTILNIDDIKLNFFIQKI